MHNIEIFPWNNNFATGIDTIDNQHKQLVHLINQLAVHITSHADEATLQNVFTELTDYVQHHFRAEEKILLPCFGDDPAVTAHLHAHHAFEDKIQDLQLELQDKSLAVVLEDTLSFLVHWLVLHILETDKRMASVVLVMQQGLSFSEAQQQVDQDMSGASEVLIKTILAMYETLSSKTLQLMKEISHRQQAEQRLRLAGKAIENTLEAIFITDTEEKVVDVNPSFCAASGYKMDAVIGHNIRNLHPALNQESNIWKTVRTEGHWAGEIQRRGKDGDTVSEWLNLSAIQNDAGKITHYVGVFSNVSLLIERQKDLRHIATHDALTGLPNRLLLRDRLEQEIKNNQRQKNELLLLLFIDLDGFKTINDTFGHEAGDAVLVQTAQRFGQCLRSADTVARLGGDEFVILLPHLSNHSDGIPTLDRLLQTVAQPVLFKNHELKVTLSIGVVAYPEHSDNIDELLLLADQAMYTAKQLGKNRYVFRDRTETE